MIDCPPRAGIRSTIDDTLAFDAYLEDTGDHGLADLAWAREAPSLPAVIWRALRRFGARRSPATIR